MQAGFHLLLPSPGTSTGSQTHGAGGLLWGITDDHVGLLPLKGSSGGPGAL